MSPSPCALVVVKCLGKMPEVVNFMKQALMSRATNRGFLLERGKKEWRLYCGSVLKDLVGFGMELGGLSNRWTGTLGSWSAYITEVDVSGSRDPPNGQAGARAKVAPAAPSQSRRTVGRADLGRPELHQLLPTSDFVFGRSRTSLNLLLLSWSYRRTAGERHY